MKSLQLAQPHLLMLVGLPGSGKSAFAEKFAETFGAPYVCADVLRPYLHDETAIRHIMNGQIKQLLKTHQTIVVDGATEVRAERAELSRLARANGYEPLLIWVQTDPATAKSRSLKAGKEGTRPSLSPEEYDSLVERFAAPNAAEKPVVISGKHTYATQTKVILKKLSEPRASISVNATPPTRSSEPIRRNITIR